ncbi:aspartate carbamoyltransferase [Patescibacteria group bacterium]|nr:aspartate carbamoyltransferase [Patescibacteria group bacterium]MBU1015548.1 aspartate carbamoyltransferase [Patescibacteria group bacterium]MBU1685599.1 aspartate carbamoyltransferase [Patescibacteria group bacterium]MBU1938983.1 aspartate carbamoyltransferase [Patescibacteria group bacterium]
MDFKGADILSVNDLTLEDVKHIMEVADEMLPYASRERITRVLEGAVLANIFFQPSTRTRVSFGSAFNRLGGAVRDIIGVSFSSIVKGESIHDTSRVISGYADVMTVRDPKEGAVKEFADATQIPVINGGDGPGEHPTQGLLDIYTLYRELAQIDGMTIAMIGDLKNGRTVHSLSKLLALHKNIRFKFIAPPKLQMPHETCEYIMDKNHNHKIVTVKDLAEGINDADVIYDTRIQEQCFESEAEFQHFQGMYKINRNIVKKHCKKTVLILHPLPRDSRPESNELDHDLNGLRNLGIFRQTDNGIPIRMAIFALVLGVVDKVHKSSRQVEWFVPKQIDPEYPEEMRTLLVKTDKKTSD